jgi:DNA repair ATPase RecN
MSELADEQPAAVFTGARWIRAALQVNPYGYKGAGAPARSFPDEASYNAALLDRCEVEGIGLIAVTDHWCVDSAAGLITAAEGRPVVVLPGFEANTAEGIHLLVLFEAGAEAAEVNAAIGACGVSPGCANGTTGNSFADILRAITERGALVVPAHVNVGNSGLLMGRGGTPLQAMIKHRDLLAIGTSPGVDPAPDQADIVQGRKPYDRQYPLAEVWANDVSHPDGLAKEGATSWFKASTPSLAAIKHAVRIPVTRVSLQAPDSATRVLFRELSWTGGFLDGVTISLADDLTAFIGGRGTGKSSVIESLRYVLDERPIGETAQRDHQAIVSNVLGAGTSIRLVVEAVSPNRGSFVIERSVLDPPVVYDASGHRTNLRPADVVGKIEMFGQHELAEVAQQKTSVARMIERFAGVPEALGDREALERHLGDNRERLRQAEADRQRLVEELADTPRLEAAIEQYQASDLPARLKEQKRLRQDEATFTEARTRLALASTAIAGLADSDVVNQLVQPYEGAADSPQAEVLQRVVGATATLSTAIETAQAALAAALQVATTDINTAHAAWEAVVAPQREQHAEVLRKLRAEGHEPERYLATTSALDDLRSKMPRLTGLDKQITQLLGDRTTLLGEVEALEREERQYLADAIRRANAATGGVVVVKPIASPDRSHLAEVVEKRVMGARKALLAAVEADTFSPRAFVAAARAGELEARYGLKGAQVLAIEAAGETFFREFEELTVGLAVDVSLDVSVEGGPRVYRRLDELSKGQRATALLLLLLGASESPLVIDQPEDDLDNRFVYDQVVKKLREMKGGRQIIVSTHNANVPVLGDAELIVTLEGDGRNGWCKEGCTGSLDNVQVRQVAEHILEGGRAAFDARRHLYGF